MSGSSLDACKLDSALKYNLTYVEKEREKALLALFDACKSSVRARLLGVSMFVEKG